MYASVGTRRLSPSPTESLGTADACARSGSTSHTCQHSRFKELIHTGSSWTSRGARFRRCRRVAPLAACGGPRTGAALIPELHASQLFRRHRRRRCIAALSWRAGCRHGGIFVAGGPLALVGGQGEDAGGSETLVGRRLVAQRPQQVAIAVQQGPAATPHALAHRLGPAHRHAPHCRHSGTGQWRMASSRPRWTSDERQQTSPCSTSWPAHRQP